MIGLRRVIMVYSLKSGKVLKSDPQIMSRVQEENEVRDYLVAVVNPYSTIAFVSGGSLHVVSAGNIDYMVLDTTEHDEDSE